MQQFTGNYMVDSGLQEQVSTPVGGYIKRPAYVDTIKQIKQPQQAKTVPEYEKLGFESQQEFDLVQDVKKQGGTAQDAQEILEQFRNQRTQPVEPVEGEISGLDVGVKTGEAISNFGEGLKFESQEDDRAITSIAKFFGNLPGDTLQLAGDLIGVASDPVGTVKGVEDFAGSMVEKGLNKVFGKDFYTTEERRMISDAVSSELKKISDDPSILKDMAVNNPADILFSVTGGLGVAKNAAKTKGMTNLASKIEKVENLTNPITLQKEAIKGAGKVVGKVGKTTGETGLTLTGVATGLTPDTVKTLFKNPDIVKSGITRESVADNVVSKIDDRIFDVKQLGKEYDIARQGNVLSSGDEIQGIAKGITDKLDLKEITKADQGAIDDAMFYVNKYNGDVTDSNLLALRQQLDSIKYDANGNKRKLSKNGDRIVTQLRADIDNVAKERIPGLKELDAKYSSEIQELNKVRNMVFDRNGDLKDNYIQQISNLMGKGKEVKLDRIKQLVPEIETEINALKALENIEYAKGRQIGSYVQGGGLVGVATGAISPITAALGLILTSPTIVSNMVRAAGYSARTVGSITQKIKDGVKLTAQEAQIVSKAMQDQINTQASKAKDSLGDLADNVADRTGARAKFVDDGGTGMSGKIDNVYDFFDKKPKDFVSLGEDLLNDLYKNTFNYRSELQDIKNSYNNGRSPLKIREDIKNLKLKYGSKDIYPSKELEVEEIIRDAFNVSSKIFDRIEIAKRKINKANKGGNSLDDFKEVGTTESALIKEAKKYKSADEFVMGGIFSEARDSKSRNIIKKGLRKYIDIEPSESLIPDINNPKLDIDTIRFKKERIEKGDRPFVLVDGDNVKDGHHTLQAYKEMGYDEVPVVDINIIKEIYNQANK